MLNVALGRGTLELRSALLNTEYLNSQLVRAPRALSRFSPGSRFSHGFHLSDSRLRLHLQSRAWLLWHAQHAPLVLSQCHSVRRRGRRTGRSRRGMWAR